MSRSHSVSTKRCMSKAVIPMAPFGVQGRPVESHITFVVSPDAILAPQTGHPWFVEMNHEMGNLKMYSLIPQPNKNQYVQHFLVEEQRPRIIGSFSFTDSWMTTRHSVHEFADAEVHYSENFYNPLKTDTKLFFDTKPCARIEIIAPRFLDDREVLDIVGTVAPSGCQIEELLQRRS